MIYNNYSIESEVKKIFSSEGSPESKAKLIIKFTDFKEEHIIQVLKMGGRDTSEIYGNLVKFYWDEKDNIHKQKPNRVKLSRD